MGAAAREENVSGRQQKATCDQSVMRPPEPTAHAATNGSRCIDRRKMRVRPSPVPAAAAVATTGGGDAVGDGDGNEEDDEEDDEGGGALYE